VDIEYRGANCVVIKSKKGNIVVDPTQNVGKVKETSDKETITLATQDGFAPSDASFVVNMPGEYEHNDISIAGIPMQRQIDPEGKSAVAYSILMDDVRIAVVGHISAPIADEDLESLGIIDVAIVPVGGGGYTLDARDAVAVVRQLDPKIVVPVHYSDDGVKYEVPQEKLELFVKELGAPTEKCDKLSIKNAQLPGALTVYELKCK